MKKNNSAYAALAPFYERLATEDYSGWGDFAAELIEKYAASKKGADAACGSGKRAASTLRRSYRFKRLFKFFAVKVVKSVVYNGYET